MAESGNILIIDDDVDIRDMFEDLLSEEGYSVTAAESGPNGLKAFVSTRFDLVLCDLIMPGMGGIEVLSKIREQSNVPCIILSGHITPHYHQMCLKTGATDIFEKPVDYSHLKMRVKSMITS